MTEFSFSELRTKIKHERAKISSNYRAQASNQICESISNLEVYHKAQHIALYHATETEIDVSYLWKRACDDNKKCYFPVLNESSSLIFLPADIKTPFKKNKLGIWEPEVSKELAIPVNQLDLVVLPLVAFDFYCHRIGMGAGYYDRALEHADHPTLIGVGYQIQRVEQFEPKPWDVPLDAVVTQRAIYWRNRMEQ